MVDPRAGSSASAARKSSSASSSAEFTQSPQQPLKVPIPRLRRPSATGDDGSGGSAGGSGGDKHRVSHACEPCRQRKTKVCADNPFRTQCFFIYILYNNTDYLPAMFHAMG